MEGTGKSLTCEEVCAKSGLTHVDIGVLAKTNDMYNGWDEQYQCPILDEDKVTHSTIPVLCTLVSQATPFARKKRWKLCIQRFVSLECNC